MSDDNSPWMLTRREMLGVTASAVLIPLLTPRLLAAMSPFTFAARFFTAAEFAMVDELSEIIIPTDDHSPGARAARVAGEIDRKLSETFETEWQARWRSGLQSVDALSVELNGKRFMQATAGQRLAVVTQMAAGEEDPRTPAQQFFGQLKGATGQAYYTSKIGIHSDQDYKGNVYQQGEYAGFDAT